MYIDKITFTLGLIVTASCDENVLGEIPFHRHCRQVIQMSEGGRRLPPLSSPLPAPSPDIKFRVKRDWGHACQKYTCQKYTIGKAYKMSFNLRAKSTLSFGCMIHNSNLMNSAHQAFLRKCNTALLSLSIRNTVSEDG